MSKNYTVEEVAKKLRVSRSHVYRLVKRGDLQKVEGIGKVVRISSSELNKFTNKRLCEYDSEKVETIEMSLGKVRKIKNKTGIQIFKNGLFQISLKLENGQIVYDAETVAKSLGFIQKKNSAEYVRWERVNEYLKVSPEVGKGDFIPEPAVYKLAFKANNEVAEKFQDWLATEVIPSIRTTGGYVANAPKFINNYFSNFSTDLRHEMIKELKVKIDQLSDEKENIDKQLLESIKTIDDIENTLGEM